MSDFSKVEFEVDADGRGSLLLDGQDVSKIASGFDIRCRVGERTKITLYMHGDIVGHVEGEVKPETPLEILIREAVAAFDAMTPEQQHAHRKAQRRSWVVGELRLQHPEMSRIQVESIVDEAMLS